MNNKPFVLDELLHILEANKDKRVVVIGTTCTGKTTLLRSITNAYDMDKLVFPLLTQEEHDLVCQDPWTPEIGKVMARLVREKVVVEAGKPVFGTVVLDSDLIVYLRISDALLRERVEARGASFVNAKNMQSQIEEEVRASGIPMLELHIG